VAYIALCRALSPLRLIDRRLPWLERMLRIRSTDAEFAGIRAACVAEGRRLGEFYRWKAVNAVLLACMKRLDADGIRRLVARVEAPGDDLPALPAERGAIFAIPHHGHFVLSIISLADRLSARREVYIFYESPGAHRSNALFDLLHERIFAAAGSRVHVVHNDRRGLATALRALSRGAALVILPDVYKDVEDTFLVPFHGRQWHAMLGTAAMARKTDSVIHPVVSRPEPGGWGFRTRIGAPIEHGVDAGAPRDDGPFPDYRTTFALFAALGELMRSSLVHWQYAGACFAHAAPFTMLDADAIEANEELFLADPRLRVATTPAISLAPGDAHA
jgi:hypothetical protein